MPRTNFLLLWVLLTEASVLASVAVLPYAFALRQKAPWPAARLATRVKLILKVITQGQLVYGIASGIGLLAGRRIGLGPVVTSAILEGRNPHVEILEVFSWVGAGCTSAVAVILLDLVLFPKARQQFRQARVGDPGVCKRLGAVLYGAVAEEVLIRLGILTSIAALIAALIGETNVPVSGLVMWPSIAISSLIFGLGHLPVTAKLVWLTDAIIIRSVLLNGISGAVFGWAYWVGGLEAAMVAHASAGIVFQFTRLVITPLMTSELAKDSTINGK